MRSVLNGIPQSGQSHNLEESCRSLYVFSPIVAQPMWVQQSHPSHCRAFASHITALRQMVQGKLVWHGAHWGQSQGSGSFWRVVKVLLSMAMHRACSHQLQLSHWSALDLHDTPLSHIKQGAVWLGPGFGSTSPARSMIVCRARMVRGGHGLGVVWWRGRFVVHCATIKQADTAWVGVAVHVNRLCGTSDSDGVTLLATGRVLVFVSGGATMLVSRHVIVMHSSNRWPVIIGKMSGWCQCWDGWAPTSESSGISTWFRTVRRLVSKSLAGARSWM